MIGHYSCSNGDIWSLELGVLSDEQSRLITTFKPVRRGTNGGVTIVGLQAAAAAGTVIGLAFVLPGFFTKSCTNDEILKQLLVIPLTAAGGLAGSLIDSILGATLQFSGFCNVLNKVVMALRNKIKRHLKLPHGYVMEYKPHDASLRDNSS